MCGVVGFADAEAEDVGEVLRVAGAGAVADVLDSHAWLGPEGWGEGSDECCAGGGDELFFDVRGVGGKAAEEVGSGGGGDGEAAVGAVNHAAADVDGGGEPLYGMAGFGERRGVEGVDAGGGGDDIDDGVDCSYFVEVNFFYADVVDFGFGGAEEFEGLDGGLFDGGWEGCGGDEVADDGERAVVGVFLVVRVGMAGLVLVLGFGMVLVGVCVLVGGVCFFVFVAMCLLGELSALGEVCAFVDVDLGGGDSAAVYFFDLEGCVEVQGGYGVVEDLWVDSGVEEGSEEHVATDAGEAVEVSDTHGFIVSCSWCGVYRAAGRMEEAARRVSFMEPER